MAPRPSFDLDSVLLTGAPTVKLRFAYSFHEENCADDLTMAGSEEKIQSINSHILIGRINLIFVEPVKEIAATLAMSTAEPLLNTDL